MCRDIRDLAVTSSAEREDQKLEIAFKGEEFASVQHNSVLMIFIIIKCINKTVRSDCAVL